MTSSAQPKAVLSFEERMKLVVKPQPRKPMRGFFRESNPEKPGAQVQAEVEVPPTPAVQVQTEAEVPPVLEAQVQAEAEIPPTPEAQPVQVSLKESYERVQQELYQVYKREKSQVPRTPADQMVFVESYREIVEQLKTIYARGTGKQPPLADARWRKCFAEIMAMFQTFYGCAQQSPEALAQIKRLFMRFYTQARKQQLQAATPQESPVPIQAHNPPPIDPQQIPEVAQPVQPAVAKPAQPTSQREAASPDLSHYQRPTREEQQPLPQAAPACPSSIAPPPAQPAVVKPAQPAARSNAASPDLSNSRRWTPQEQQQLQQGKQAFPANPPMSIAHPRLSPPPVNSQPMPQTPPPIAPSQNFPQMSVVPASNPPATPVRRDDFRSAPPQYQRDRQSWDPRASRREYLLRERLLLERELQRNLGNANALNERWQLWGAHKTQLERDKAFVPVQEVFSYVARRLIRVPLPSAARQVSFREQRLHQEAIWLQQQAIAINTRHNTLLQEIQLMNTELEMLNF